MQTQYNGSFWCASRRSAVSSWPRWFVRGKASWHASFSGRVRMAGTKRQHTLAVRSGSAFRRERAYPRICVFGQRWLRSRHLEAKAARTSVFAASSRRPAGWLCQSQASQPTRQRSLTPRSRRGPTASHQARAGGTLYIFASPGLAPCRRSRLTSNVRLHMETQSLIAAPQDATAVPKQGHR